ncbi:hypothetical protein AB0230_07165 [Microbacterium sp. NPDC089190]|uniref:hypothetical protein n=1 Tax=Microbacterium sp. NPDC089190 TaxID=3155063 RepID=UPI00344F1E2F
MSERSIATRRVMKTIARRSTYETLPVRGADGSLPIVVALPDDRLIDIARHVHEEFDGAANIFVAMPDQIALIGFSFGPDRTHDAEVQRAHDNTSMAMYVAYLRMHPGAATLNINMADASTELRDMAYAF